MCDWSASCGRGGVDSTFIFRGDDCCHLELKVETFATWVIFINSLVWYTHTRVRTPRPFAIKTTRGSDKQFQRNALPSFRFYKILLRDLTWWFPATPALLQINWDRSAGKHLLSKKTAHNNKWTQRHLSAHIISLRYIYHRNLIPYSFCVTIIWSKSSVI